MKNPLWSDGIERGQFMTAFVSSRMNLASSTVLDIGCGYGGISLAFARCSREVYSIDHDSERIAVIRNRIRAEGVANMHLLTHDGRALPFETGQFDLVLLNGVLEYLGVNMDGVNPKQLQFEALREIRRVLRPGGTLYVGIENRNYPGYLKKDVHSGLPLVSMMPRWTADLISQSMRGKPFQHYIYSAWGLSRLFKRAGYKGVDFYAPLFNYQYPIVFMPMNSGGRVREWLRRADDASISPSYRRMSFGRSPKRKKLIFWTLGRTGLTKLLCPCFVVLATTASPSS